MTNKIIWLEHPNQNHWEVAYLDGKLIGHYEFGCGNTLTETTTKIYIGTSIERITITIGPSKETGTKLKKIARNILETYYMSLKDESLAS